MTISLKIGGVPEHFNLPIRLAIEEGLFAAEGLNIQWRDCPGGTGEISALLQAGELDMATPLSSGTVTAIAKGCPIKILGWYVSTPLIWGIHVPAQSYFLDLDELRTTRVAISCFGSGSHLMVNVLAKEMGWIPERDIEYVVVKNLDGAIKAFNQDQADCFLWERFTTQPLVDAGIMRRIGDCPTPWPAFVLAASEKALSEKQSMVSTAWRIILDQCSGFKQRPGLAALIAERYGLQQSQVSRWLELTEWSKDAYMNRSRVQELVDALDALGLLESPVRPRFCVSEGTELQG